METSFGMHSLTRAERVKHMLKLKLLEEQEAADAINAKSIHLSEVTLKIGE